MIILGKFKRRIIFVDYLQLLERIILGKFERRIIFVVNYVFLTEDYSC